MTARGESALTRRVIRPQARFSQELAGREGGEKQKAGIVSGAHLGADLAPEIPASRGPAGLRLACHGADLTSPSTPAQEQDDPPDPAGAGQSSALSGSALSSVRRSLRAALRPSYGASCIHVIISCPGNSTANPTPVLNGGAAARVLARSLLPMFSAVVARQCSPAVPYHVRLPSRLEPLSDSILPYLSKPAYPTRRLQKIPHTPHVVCWLRRNSSSVFLDPTPRQDEARSRRSGPCVGRVGTDNR
jgi:hypothetical protein